VTKKKNGAFFEGKSGSKFGFEIQDTWLTPVARQGVYIVTNQHPHDALPHQVVYIGHSADLISLFVDHPKENCFAEYKAECLCILSETDNDRRKEIMHDLIATYNPPHAD
jgi:hypothetical protein